MAGLQDDRLLMAAAGLEGGLVASGSTCGVVTGGALGLGLAHDQAIKNMGIPAEIQAVEAAGRYVRFFRDHYRTQLCRQRTGVDFHTTSGQLRYLFPGDRMARCFSHIYGAMRRLEQQAPGMRKESQGQTAATSCGPVHCAREVLRAVREQTGTGHEVTERVSCVLDGGVGLSGGVCGAMAGAVMAVNLVLGHDVRNAGFWETVKAFSIGHGNLLVKNPRGAPEPFSMGKQLLSVLKEEAGSLECRAITGRDFRGWEDFQAHARGSERCRALMDLAAQQATGVIQGL